MPLTGGAPIILAADQNQAWLGLAIDDANIYWTATGFGDDDGAILKLAKDGSGTPVTLASAQSKPGPLTVDDTSVYLTNTGSGHVMRVPKDGGDTSRRSLPTRIFRGPSRSTPPTLYWSVTGKSGGAS